MTMLARGKLSTLNREVRMRRTKIRDALEAICNRARVAARFNTDDGQDMTLDLKDMQALIEKTLVWNADIQDIQPTIQSLRDEAWPKGKP